VDAAFAEPLGGSGDLGHPALRCRGGAADPLDAPLDAAQDAAGNEDMDAGADHQGPVNAALESGELGPRLGPETGLVPPLVIEAKDQRVVREPVAARKGQLPPQIDRLHPEAGQRRPCCERTGAGGRCVLAVEHSGPSGGDRRGHRPLYDAQKRLPGGVGTGIDERRVLIDVWQPFAPQWHEPDATDLRKMRARDVRCRLGGG
jgi:hypothetical protein